MPIVYRFDVLEGLKKAGYSAERLLDEKLLSEAAIQKLRQCKMVTFSSLETICRLLYLQPGDVIGMLWDENDAFIPIEPIKPRVYKLDGEIVTLK